MYHEYDNDYIKVHRCKYLVEVNSLSLVASLPSASSFSLKHRSSNRDMVSIRIRSPSDIVDLKLK